MKRILLFRLNDMAREHWGYARDQMESLRKDLLNQFRRIEVRFRD